MTESGNAQPEKDSKKLDELKKILFTLLSEGNSVSLEKIAAQTAIPNEVVGEILSKLENKGKIKQENGRFSLTPEIEHQVSMLFAMEQEQAKRKKFEKYNINLTHQAEIETGKPFDLKQLEQESGSFQFIRSVSPHEEAYCFEKKVYFVWKEGPRSGESYYQVDKFNESNVQIVTPSEFFDTVKNFVFDIAQNKSRTALAELHTYVLSIFYGKDSLLGWDQARFYDLFGEGEAINQLMVAMLAKGLPQFLADYAKSQGIEVHSWQLNFQERDTYPLYYDGLDHIGLRGNYWDGDPPIMLVHGTYSHILPNLIQMRGLSARDYYQSFGIKKYYGGEGQGEGSYMPHDVSFWFHEDGQPIISGGYGSQRAYDYPMQIGLAKDKAEQLQLRLGTMNNELVVPNYVPFNFITHIFVPSFKIEEVSSLLTQNNITHVKVLPLRQS